MKPHELDQVIGAVMDMRHNRLQNYIVPGLTSHLIGDAAANGKIRLFEATRSARDWVTPHSHRFNFTAIVLKGMARNTIFDTHPSGELWCESTIDQVCGADGLREYQHVRAEAPTLYRQITTDYGQGSVYSMGSNEIHSIVFDRGTVVLFFEGPPLTTRSTMIEPWVDGQVVPTFKTEAWMFLRDQGNGEGAR